MEAGLVLGLYRHVHGVLHVCSAERTNKKGIVRSEIKQIKIYGIQVAPQSSKRNS